MHSRTAVASVCKAWRGGKGAGAAFYEDRWFKSRCLVGPVIQVRRDLMIIDAGAEAAGASFTRALSKVADRVS